MKKFYLLTLISFLSCGIISAADYVTVGDGTTYTFQSLSEIMDSGVTKDGSTYEVANNITISVNDKFQIENGITVKMGNTVQLRIDGSANFEATERVLFTRSSNIALPKGVYIMDDINVTKFKNIDFEYCGLRAFGDKGLTVDNCTFRYNNGKLSGSGALSFGQDNTCYTITNCTFESNEVPGVGGPANLRCGCIIENCTFIDNNTKNSNKPQINISVGGDNEVIIRDCTLTGAQRTKVGGIAISNTNALEGANIVTIENNDIRGHRYGITTNYGHQQVTIKGNKIIDNCYAASAAAGGSGISIYDNVGVQTVVITNNHFEKNWWGITVIGGGEVNVGKTEDPSAADYNPGGNVFKDNGNNGKLYDIYNNTALTIYAQGNKWGVDEQTAEKIETVIFHKNDDASRGEVIFMPAMEEGGVSDIVTDDENIQFINGEIQVQSAETIIIYTLSGQMVQEFNDVKGSVDISSLQKGLYIAYVKTATGVHVVKCLL